MEVANAYPLKITGRTGILEDCRPLSLKGPLARLAFPRLYRARLGREGAANLVERAGVIGIGQGVALFKWPKGVFFCSRHSASPRA